MKMQTVSNKHNTAPVAFKPRTSRFGVGALTIRSLCRNKRVQTIHGRLIDSLCPIRTEVYPLMTQPTGEDYSHAYISCLISLILILTLDLTQCLDPKSKSDPNSNS